MMIPQLLALAAAIGSAQAHYIWTNLKLGSVAGGVGEGIRPNTNYNSPVTDLSSTDLRCNVGGLNGANTVTREVKAGESFTWHSDVAVYHQGPVSVFLSKAPSSAKDYDGSGLWAKIGEQGPTFDGGSAKWPLYQDYTFTLPSCIADGEYLLKISQLGIHNPYPSGIPQFYTACAQIKVTGGSGSGISPSLSIPGAFKATDPGYTVNIYDPSFKSYTAPGGAVSRC